MRKLGRSISALVLALVMFLGMTGTAQASSSLTFNGQGNEFIFTSGTSDQEYPTDLFSSFKNVMPGDTMTEQITIRNNAASRADVRFHLLSSGAADQVSREFLGNLTLTIARADGTQLYSGSAGGAMGEVDLGRLAFGGSVTLTVTLQVPIELDNSFQDAAGHIVWRIRIEEYNDAAAATGGGGSGGGGGGGAPADAVLTATPAVAAILPPPIAAVTPVEAEVITDEEIPLGNGEAQEDTDAPDIPAGNVDIGDEETPLAAPKGWALLNLLLAVLTVVVSAVLLTGWYAGRKRDEENGIEEYQGEEQAGELKRKSVIRISSFLPAAASVISFILTENMSSPMVLVDKWTLWMAVFAAANIALAVFSMKTRKQRLGKK